MEETVTTPKTVETVHRWMTAKEAADYMRINVVTLYDLKARGKIPFHKPFDEKNGKLLFFIDELDEFLKSK